VTIRRSDAGTIVLEGPCAAEDAELLLQLLEATPFAAVDWTACRQIHTSVLQVVLASGIVPSGPCGDIWVEQWLAPALSGQE
jgi:hypothetical protein